MGGVGFESLKITCDSVSSGSLDNYIGRIEQHTCFLNSRATPATPDDFAIAGMLSEEVRGFPVGPVGREGRRRPTDKDRAKGRGDARPNDPASDTHHGGKRSIITKTILSKRIEAEDLVVVVQWVGAL